MKQAIAEFGTGDNRVNGAHESLAEEEHTHLGVKGGLKGFLQVLFADELEQLRAIPGRQYEPNSQLDSQKPTA